MRKNFNKYSILQGVCLFLMGGLLYVLIELCWRQRTHWSMFVVGGVCFRVIGRIYRALSHRRLALRCTLSAIAVTVIEFFSGCFFNLHLKLEVWDYTDMPLNIGGQVCLLYSVLWALLSIPAGFLHTICEQKLRRRRKKAYLPTFGQK